MSRRGQRVSKPRVISTADPRGIGYLTERFLEWRQGNGFSEITIYGETRKLEYFAVWCEARGVTKPVEVTKAILERYHRYLYNYRKKDGMPLTFRSQKAFLTPIRAYFRWLTRNNYIPSNPAADLDLPKEEKRLPRAIFTVEEVEQVISKVDLNELRGIRDRAKWVSL